MHQESTSGADMPAAVGDIFAGKYEVTSVLGFGAFAWVYRARHTLVSSLDVAVKVLRQEHLNETDTLRRFHQEAETAARLKSRFTTKITDFGITDSGSPFLVMDFIEGMSLEEYIKRVGRVTPEAAARWGAQVLRALEEAHGVGIVHRDLKPANIYVVADPDGDELDIRVLDFGIAKIMDRASGAAEETATGQLFCSPRYASPELLRGHPSPQSDIYALGITLCELIDGRVPYPEPDFFSVAARHLAEEPVPIGPEVKASVLSDVIRRSLEKPLGQRFKTARDMRKAIESAVGDSSDSTAKLPTPTELRDGKFPAVFSPPAVAATVAPDSAALPEAPGPHAAQSTLISPKDHAALITIERAIERATASPPVVDERPNRRSPLLLVALAALILIAALTALQMSGSLQSSKPSPPDTPPEIVPDRPPPIAIDLDGELADPEDSAALAPPTPAIDAGTAIIVAEARGASLAVGTSPVARRICETVSTADSRGAARQTNPSPSRSVATSGGQPSAANAAEPNEQPPPEQETVDETPPENPFAGPSLMGGR